MPIYDYVCSNCGHRMEVSHSIHGHGPSACPVCGGPMKKAYSAPAVHFKGTGWARKERSSGPKPSRSRDSASSDAGSAPSSEPGHSKADESAS